jgi:MerR family transcriptional regulator/heat shock protein HspR
MPASELPQRIDHDAPVFVISVAAHLAGMHPQTLRTYDRMGLVSPRRTAKRGRRYSARDIARLRLIQRLSQDEGINLEGIRRILHMQDDIDELRARVDQLTALLAAFSPSTVPGSSPLIRSGACISADGRGVPRWRFPGVLCHDCTSVRRILGWAVSP